VDLNFRRFQEKDYGEYASWFVDPELNHRLGPLDEAWLGAVLFQEAEGETWVALRGEERVAVVETAFDPQGCLPTVITGLAVKPGLRRQGIGTAVLKGLLRMHRRSGRLEHAAYISADNEAARRCFERVGFVPLGSQPNEYGYLEFRHR